MLCVWLATVACPLGASGLPPTRGSCERELRHRRGPEAPLLTGLLSDRERFTGRVSRDGYLGSQSPASPGELPRTPTDVKSGLPGWVGEAKQSGSVLEGNSKPRRTGPSAGTVAVPRGVRWAERPPRERAGHRPAQQASLGSGG